MCECAKSCPVLFDPIVCKLSRLCSGISRKNTGVGFHFFSKGSSPFRIKPISPVLTHSTEPPGKLQIKCVCKFYHLNHFWLTFFTYHHASQILSGSCECYIHEYLNFAVFPVKNYCLNHQGRNYELYYGSINSLIYQL